MLTVYSKEKCPACIDAKDYLIKVGAEFKVVMIVTGHPVDETEINRDVFLTNFQNVRNVPYIVNDNGEVYRTVAELKQAI